MKPWARVMEHDLAYRVWQAPFAERKLTTSWAYVRLHRGSRGSYSKAELATWRRRIAAWRSKAEVLAYFNNTETSAAENATSRL